MGLKLLLKRGGLLAAANWPTIAIQFAAEKTFQLLLAVPIVGAAILVAVLLGADFGNLLQGNLRDTFAAIASALIAEPIALIAFIAAFGIVLIGGSILMFLIKGGVISVMLAADETVGPIERQPITFALLRAASRFSMTTFVDGCQRLFRRYLILGTALMAVYAVSAGAYLGFIVYGYRAAGESGFVIGWTLIGAMLAVALVVWITCVNLLYLLIQIVSAAEDIRLGAALRAVLRFVRAEIVELGAVFLIVCGLVLASLLASTLAGWAVTLIGFVPLVGLAVLPLNIVALVVPALVNQYIGLMAMGAYVSLYRRHLARVATADQMAGSSAVRPASAG